MLNHKYDIKWAACLISLVFLSRRNVESSVEEFADSQLPLSAPLLDIKQSNALISVANDAQITMHTHSRAIRTLQRVIS